MGRGAGIPVLREARALTEGASRRADISAIPSELDVAVIGGGQAALAVGFYLRRTGLRYRLLDEQPQASGAWSHTWPSLRLFSPAQWSSLPGWMMPRDTSDPDGYPSRQQVIAYLTEYERRYELPVERPVRVNGVHRDPHGITLDTTAGHIRARAVVSATGTWAHPVVPEIQGQDEFRGSITHSATYAGPAEYAGKRVLIVGGGNSGAQILAELSLVADATWVTRDSPSFLPDEVDGRYLFEQATLRYRALQEGRTPDPPRSLGDVVMVPPVRAARERGVLVAQRMFTGFTPTGVTWSDGREERIDAVVYATGFRPALAHLEPLGITGPNGRVEMSTDVGTRAATLARLWLVGYGEWTGFASATLIGVGRSARATVDDIVRTLAAER